ncbi:MAG TPA: glutamine--tRNA ligase/YqeY domain fusion protein [Polyangia bacterium]|nr:glutamine--tRNA ligase/YqeY domain fusion protein [Polyangia bacterium]
MSEREGPSSGPESAGNFIRDVMEADRKSGKYGGRVATRFPPEPNGYLHIGHAKAICINFGLAREFGGTTNLRFDDTNPTTEDVEYVEAIQQDIRWLGFQWHGLYYASDYFEQLYQIAEKLVEKGRAYVDSASEEEIREYRGNYYKKGRPTPDRDRPPAESLDLLRRMRAGEFKEGAYVLRAKIDLSSQNMNLRDPILYRIRYAPHHRTGQKWCIYPMYDYAHPLSDAIEEISHSLCSLEFEDHRPLYDWCIREAEVYPSRQIEFARLHLTYTVMSKRKLAELVQNGLVSGWDDPRMPTLAGMRRLGYPPEAIRAFCERIGVAKADSVVDVGLLEYCVREDLNRRCPRVMAVLRPLKLVIENFPEGEVRQVDAPLHPEDPGFGTRKVPFARELLIERDDFREDPPKDWFRLAPGREVRLRYACLVKCTLVIKDPNGEATELRCTWDPASWGGTSPDGRVVRGTLHWLSAAHAGVAEARLYDRLFKVASPGADEARSFLEDVNPDSLVRLPGCRIEPYLLQATPGARYQFERLGYFCVDLGSAAGKPVFNRTVTLRDTWAKIEAKGKGKVEESKSRRVEESKSRKVEESKVEESKVESQKSKAAETRGAAEECTIEDFQKLDLRVGIVRAAELVPEADKLIRLQVDLGEGRLRQIFAGLRASYPDPQVLVGQRVIVVANLKPRQMKFGLSEGMVLAAGGGTRPHRVAIVDRGQGADAPAPGDKVR